jgi:hypothetical protein
MLRDRILRENLAIIEMIEGDERERREIGREERLFQIARIAGR